MDWNAKWELEKWVMFNSNAFERPEKLSADWEIGEGEIDNWSFSGGGGGRSQSSLRSSISASTDSSSKELFKISPLQDYTIGSGDQSISLKLGKRTYFENNSTGCNSKTTSLSGNPASSITSTEKNIKSVCQRRPLCCQVEGCNLDLTSAKEYHRKHRVCESHSKCPKVVIGGLERRFCQQCSRFHGLSEFDEKKRSCRKRLSNHNARRRKPQRAINFNSTRFSSPFSDQTHYTSSIRNCPLVHTSSCINSSWESTCKSDLTLTKGYMSKSGKTGGVDGQLQVPGTDMSLAIGMVGQNSYGLLPCKGSEAEVSTQGLKEPILSPNLNAAPNFQSALSLLSTNSWVLEPTSLDYPSIHSSPTNVPQTSIYTVFQGLPLISSDSRHLHTITRSYGFHSHM